MHGATDVRIDQGVFGDADLVAGHGPWPRLRVDEAGWSAAIGLLADGHAELVSLWGDTPDIHMALRSSEQVVVLSLLARDGRYPSVGLHHPPAIRLERAVRDLFGLEPTGLPDTRPWLDHGRWHGDRPAASDYPFLPAQGAVLHQIPVGPIHAGIIEPGHFRFTCNGETVVRLEERLGYVHKGIEGLIAGSDLARASRLAARVSGDSTVAYGYAFARAIESALGVEVPARAVWLRALMAEMERIANHLGDVGGVCNDAAFSLALVHCAMLRERLLRTAGTCFGHRLMMDKIVPGGTADLSQSGIAAIRETVDAIGSALPRLLHLYDETPSLQDRTTGTGRVSVDLARQFAAGGYVGRASGRDFDARRDLCYAPYDALPLAVASQQNGDVDARVRIRLDEIRYSLTMVNAILADLPDGPVLTPIPPADGEGLAIVEGFRGDVFVWLRIQDGVIRRCHLRDPSWFQWPLLEAAIDGNIVADFPLCNKSFNCSYSGHDL
ncbi:MAG TPA: NADH-quinone oxidoreductase subunit C [Rhodopila sp.]|uniref:hydrogenase large subunit n=1 Tax=Rhodopila sp. TaxID=2480087 RepID=UPI002BCF7211|nr:NADH-quinone oxidoreductase subunit C [Rhodopila sp.]HVY16890.1 NADH-quinone oxidoreductase subunit C [Rhodopila sp.]